MRFEWNVLFSIWSTWVQSLLNICFLVNYLSSHLWGEGVFLQIKMITFAKRRWPPKEMEVVVLCSAHGSPYLLPAAADLSTTFCLFGHASALPVAICNQLSNGSLVKNKTPLYFAEVLSPPVCGLNRAKFILKKNAYFWLVQVCLSFHFDTTFHIWIEETKVIYLLSCFKNNKTNSRNWNIAFSPK